jgi:Phage phiEco32-like COOH.NH2 ligase-type 2
MIVKIEDIEPGSLVEIPASVMTECGLKEKIGVVVGAQKMVYPAPGWWAPMLLTEKENGYYATCPPRPLEGLEVIERKEFPSQRAKEFLAKKRTLYHWGYASGCDPEIFVEGAKGKIIPARSYLQSKKQSPKVFYDGIQAEFCPEGRTCLEELCTRIRQGLKEVLTAAQVKNPKAKLTIKSSVKLTQAEMDKLEDEDLIFRCSNSLNIYEDSGEQPEARQYPWRFVGGHVHVGCREKTKPGVKAIVKALDGILGVAGVSLAANFDNPERRRMYGKAGEIRLPKHGLEYRVLSNYWLASPLIFHLTFELMRLAWKMGEQGMFSICWQGSEEEIRDIINWHDVKGARKMLSNNMPVLQEILRQRMVCGIWKQPQVDKIIETIMNGLETVVKDPEDVAGNWGLITGVMNSPGFLQWSQSRW